MGYVCNIEVTDIDETLEKVKATGGEVVHGKEPLEGVGFEAFCLDTEGDIFIVIHDEGLSALLPKPKRTRVPALKAVPDMFARA